MNALDGAAAAYSEGGLAELASSYEEGEVVGEEGGGKGEGERKDVAMEVHADSPSGQGARKDPLDSKASGGDADVDAVGGDVAKASDKPGAGDPKSVAGKRDGQKFEEEKKTETAQKELGLLGDVRAVSHQSLEKQLIGKAEAAAARAEEAEKEAAKAMRVQLPTTPPQLAAVSYLSRTHPPTA